MAGMSIKFGTGTVAEFTELARGTHEGALDAAGARALYLRITGQQEAALPAGLVFTVSNKAQLGSGGRVYMSAAAPVGSYVAKAPRTGTSVEQAQSGSAAQADKQEATRVKAIQTKAETLFSLHVVNPETRKPFASIEQAREYVERAALAEAVTNAAAAVAQAEHALSTARAALADAQAKYAAARKPAAPAASKSRKGSKPAAPAAPAPAPAASTAEQAQAKDRAAAVAGARHAAERGPSTASMSEALTRAAAAVAR